MTYSDLPFSADLLTKLINYSLMIAPYEAKEGFRAHLTITAKSNVSTFDAEGNPSGFREERAVGGINMFSLHFEGSQITKREVKKWMNENDEYFQNICSGSNFTHKLKIYMS